MSQAEMERSRALQNAATLPLAATRSARQACQAAAARPASGNAARSRTRYGGAPRKFVLLNGNGAPEEIRTPNLLIRSQMLYPVELRARRPSPRGGPAKGRNLMKLPRRRKGRGMPEFRPN